MYAITRPLEGTTISYEIYTSVGFQTNFMITAFYAVRAVFSTRGWRGKKLLAWFGLSSIHVLGFPTLMSATDSYVTPPTTMSNMPNGNLVGAGSDSLLSCYNVTEGMLIGLPTNDTLVYGPPCWGL